MNSGRSTLPEYAHPPLVAATLGVTFQHGSGLDEDSLREFQRQLGAEWHGSWVKAQHSPDAVDIGLVPFGQDLQNVLRDRRVRLSEHHFDFTWLGAADGRYPRYEAVRDGFVAAWDLWSQQHHPSAGTVLRWGVSYLNRIPQGTVWQTPGEWSFFRLLAGQAGVVSDDLPQRFSARWQYNAAAIQGTLGVELSLHAESEHSRTPCLWLKLTASGPPLKVDSTDLLDGMDAGRAAIVQTFSDLMSPAANAYWGLRRREK
jgi:hypothetical protein